MSTKFERWVREFGVARLSSALRSEGPATEASPSAIYQWIYAETEPRSAKALAMVKISRGKIKLQDIYRHIEVARDRRAKAQAAQAASIAESAALVRQQANG